MATGRDGVLCAKVKLSTPIDSIDEANSNKFYHWVIFSIHSIGLLNPKYNILITQDYI